MTLIPYHGQSRIARITAEYLSDEPEGVVAHKKDLVNLLFTKLDSHTADLTTPSEILGALGDRFFWQIFDAKYHKFGPLVFNEALHGGPEEPGYYESIREVCQFVRENLMPLPAMEPYLERHKRACAHFDDYKTCTQMTAREAGKVSTRPRRCNMEVSQLFEALSEQDVGRYKKYLQNSDIISDYTDVAKEFEEFVKTGVYPEKTPEQTARYNKAKEECAEFWVFLDTKIEAVNAYIAKRSRELGASEPIVTIEVKGANLLLTYPLVGDALVRCQETLFAQYKEKMHAAKSMDQKIECIADLYQLMEWIHIVPDGQGRTNLVCLGEQLAVHGSNPPILWEPYTSSLCLLEDWVKYLHRGIEDWQTVLIRLDALGPLPKPVPKVRDPAEEKERHDRQLISYHLAKFIGV